MTDPHTTAEAAIRAWWDATSGSYCDLGPTFLLCEDTGGIAARGTCPEHGGDACLYVYGKLDAALAELAAVRADLETAEARVRELEAALRAESEMRHWMERMPSRTYPEGSSLWKRWALSSPALLVPAEKEER